MRPKVKALLLVALLIVVLARIGTAVLQPPRPGPRDLVQVLQHQQGPQTLTLKGRLLEDPRPSPTGERCRALFELQPATLQGRVELAFAPCPTLQQGWWLQVSGQLSRPQAAPHPLLAGPAERLARQGAWSQMRVEQVQVLARPPTPVVDLRRQIAQRLQQHAGPSTGGVLSALVLGSAVVPLPAAIRESFRAAGLSHALAASGFHLSVLLGAVLIVGKPLGRPGRLGLASAAMVLFLLLAGPQPSVLRAVGMGALALLLLESGNGARPLLVLALTCTVLLLWRPDWLFDVGFQLSVAATAGLMLTARPLDTALARWLPPWLAAAVAVPLAAFVWTLPLQLLHFGVVPSYAIPANLLAAPLLTPLTLGAMALALVALLLPAALPLLTPPVAALTGLLIWLTERFAAMPMAQWQLGRPEPWLVGLLAFACLVVVLPALPGRWRLAGAALVLTVVALHLALLRSDQLLLVHQGRGDGGSDLLVARHQGRAALLSTSAQGFSCTQAARLSQGLGVQRFDWVLLLDPLAPEQPQCWQRLSPLVLASSDGSPPLQVGQRLASPGLSVRPMAVEARALDLQLGPRRWVLLPDRQSLWAWQERPQSPGRPNGIWLGFRPSSSERRWLAAASPSAQLWWSGSDLRRPQRRWRATGPSGSLIWNGRHSDRLSPQDSGTMAP